MIYQSVVLSINNSKYNSAASLNKETSPELYKDAIIF